MTENKKTFILIRGLLREQRHWGSFVNVLEATFPQANVITLDIPGNGMLNRQASPNTIFGMTDALRQQLDGNKQLNLIALSMGGMIALDWMTRFPLEIQSAVLINTSARPYSPFYQRLQWQCYPHILKMMWNFSAMKMETGILQLTSNLHRDDNALLSQWLDWRQQNPVSKKNAIFQLFAAARFLIQAQPRHPLLIICSKKDRLVNYQCSKKLHQCWQSDYKQHDTAGHDMPLDAPQWLAQTIYRWITDVS